MKVYQLAATGRLENFESSTRTIANLALFLSREAAEARIDRFKSAVCEGLTGLHHSANVEVRELTICNDDGSEWTPGPQDPDAEAP